MQAAPVARQKRQLPSSQNFDTPPVILRGNAQVLAVVADLDDLRIRCSQQDDLSTDLLLILSRHNASQRMPVLVLLHTDGVLSAAIIFAERQILGFGLGLLRAGDPAGDGAVIAPAPQRKAALLAAMHALLQRRRFHTVAATLSGCSTADLHQPKGLFAASASRTMRRYLPLSPTFEETLRLRFTPRKRKNLLYNVRTLAKTHDTKFIPALPTLDIEPALLQLAQHSWPPRTPAEIALHAAFLHRHPESFCMGLRLRNGGWLSLITGWRIGGITHMPWQLNHMDFKDKSLMQVMRTHLIEHECALGQTALSWVGGTVSFQTACEPELCLDVLQLRPGLRSTLIRHVIAPLLFRRNPDEFTTGSLRLLLPTHATAALAAQRDTES